MATKNMKPEDMQKLAVPPASKNTRKKPSQKRPIKVVSAEDAAASLGGQLKPGEEPPGDEPVSVRLARMRQEGTAVVVAPPPEELDDLETEEVPPVAEQPPQQAYTPQPPPPAPPPVQPTAANIVRAPRAQAPPTMGQQLQQMTAPELPAYVPPPVPAPPPPEPDEKELFFNQRTRVTIELSDGIFTIPATCVRQSKYSVLVMIPLSDNLMAFVPKPGTQLTLSWASETVDAYFPGSYVELPELECGLMSFIKAE